MNFVLELSSSPLIQVEAAGASAGRFLYCYEKLQRFRQLDAGWDRGRGNAIASTAITHVAKHLFDAYTLGFREPNVFPCSDGSVLLTFTDGGHEIEVRVGSDGLASYLHEQGEVTLAEVGELTEGQVQECIRQSYKSICSYEPSTSSITTNLNNDSSAKPSNPLRMAAYQSFARLAQSRSRLAFAGILTSSTGTLLEIQQSA